MNSPLVIPCVLWNAQSLNNKHTDFIGLIHDEDISVACITETWMTSEDNIITSSLRDAGYNIQHCHRTSKRGGGVAVIYKSKFTEQMKILNFDSFECIIVSISGPARENITFVTIYRLGEIPISIFLAEFYGFMEYIKNSFRFYVICGDFNIHIDQVFNQETIKFNDLLATFSITQSVSDPTHKLGHILDLVLHDNSEISIKNVKVDSSNPCLEKHGDHALVFFDTIIPFNIQSKKDETFTYKDFRNINIDAFKTDISSKTINYLENVEGLQFVDAYNMFHNMCVNVVDDHVQTKTVKRTSNPRPKWMDQEFLTARRQRRKLYKKWKRTKCDLDRQAFEISRNQTHSLSFSKRKDFVSQSIANCNDSQRELFKTSKNLLGIQKCSKLPNYDNPITLANQFNAFFLDKITTIREKFSTYGPSLTFEQYLGPKMEEFTLVPSNQLEKTILSKPIKTAPDDPLPAFILKTCLSEVLPALTFLVNLSLTTGCMEGLKDSLVTPLLKKPNLDCDILSNYRPVANILYMSKITEKEVLLQLNDHMTTNQLHISKQSGYKPAFSCETLLLRVSNDVIRSLDSSTCSVMLLLDLSAAFDTVDHAILLNILYWELGLRGTVFRWFESFLRNRRQSVIINGHRSSTENNLFGVPQGSVVGPVLFNIYVRSLMKFIEEAGFSIFGYADDHQVLHTFKIEFQAHALRHAIPRVMELISTWMNKHFLKLNPTKSQVIIFHPKNTDHNIAVNYVLLSGGSYIEVSELVNNLGVQLDSHMSFSSHITSVIAHGYQLLRNISGVRKFLSTNDIRSLINSLVVSKLDNCNALLYGISQYDLGRLQKFQNSCARLIYGKPKYEHVTDLFNELHWLPVRSRICFKLLCYMYKCFHCCAPPYLTEILTVSTRHNLCFEQVLCKSTIGDQAFSVCGPRLWNALPTNIRSIETLNRFKSQLKHYFFTSFNLFESNLNRYRQ